MSEIAPLIRVTGVRVLARYIVELTSEDGAAKVVGLEPYLWGEVFETLTAALDDDVSRQAVVDGVGGTIRWRNGADLSPRRRDAEAKAVIAA